MADEFRETNTTGWGGNIKNAFVGALIGMLLFFASFVVLWQNEGRVNMGKVAEKATVAAPSDRVDPAREGQAISVSGSLVTADSLGDPKFLKPGAYVALERTAEMFAWVEEKETKEKQNTGGSSTKETVYRYEKKWTSAPQDSKDFKHADGHFNPAMPFGSESFTVPSATVGAYAVDPGTMDLPAYQPLALDAAKINIKEGYQLADKYLFIGHGQPGDPQVGDIRVSFAAVPSGVRVTAFGKAEGNNLAPYLHQGKSRLYRAIAGTRDEAIALMKYEHKVTGWVLRLVGFLMMWFGLQFLFGPVVAVLNVLPFLGKVGRFVWGFISFLISFALSLVVIIVSMIAHNVWALVIVIALIVGIFVWLKAKKKAAPAVPAAPAP
ncbi:MAG TPA: TMEM43 family protein [Candidatus Edwardsbacteria bacterium]|nr:TMEM43 family protein [Candidatus Edwardsbacteria bacterium]